MAVAHAGAPLPPSGTGATAVIPPEDDQWTVPAKDYASTRFSGLNEINTGNVSNLKVAFTFPSSDGQP